MCGRTRCTLSREQVLAAAGGSQTRWINEQAYQPSYNISPGRALPVIHRTREGEVVVETQRWGLVPSFTKPDETPDFWRMFNARSESVQERPAFRRLVAGRRCLVLVEGFYEWEKQKDGKQPYYIHLAGDEPLVLAGLWDVWQGPEGPMATCTILTTDASPRLAWLHDRMPLLLRDEGAQRLWLDTSDPGSVLKLQQVLGASYNREDLVWHEVTRAMSKPEFQGPDACAPLKKLKPADFFKPRKGKAPEAQVQQQPAQGAVPAVKQEESQPAATAGFGQEQPASTAPAGASARQADTTLAQAGPGSGGVGGERGTPTAAANPDAAAVNPDERPSSAGSNLGQAAKLPSSSSQPRAKRKTDADVGSPLNSDGSKRLATSPTGGGEAKQQARSPAGGSRQQAKLVARSPASMGGKKGKGKLEGQLDITRFLGKP